jgi:bacterioferritin-associated ferredoxin
LGTGTNWTALGAGINPTVGQVFTATGAGAGSGTASDCGQCVLTANSTITSGQMNMIFSTNGGQTYATRLTNKYIYDNATPPNRYAVNFFESGETTAVVLGNVAVANTTGWFTSNATTFTTGQIITAAGAFTGNATITGYSNPTTYYVINTNGTTAFQLSATYNGANIATAAGNTRGLTFTEAVSTTVKSGADPVTWTNGTGNLTLAQVQNYTS